MYEVSTSVRSRELVAQRRQQIAEAAYDVFHEKGFKSATVEEIATRLGIDKATLYGYIDRKEDLLYIVFQHFIPQLTARLEAVAEGIEDPRRRLEALIDEQIRIVDEHRGLVLLTYRELRHLGHHAIESVFQLIDANHAPYERALRDGIAAGVFRAADPTVAVHALLSMLYMWAPYHRSLRPFGLEATAAEAKTIFFQGIAPGPAAAGDVP